jgi:hypothetical protein
VIEGSLDFHCQPYEREPRAQCRIIFLIWELRDQQLPPSEARGKRGHPSALQMKLGETVDLQAADDRRGRPAKAHIREERNAEWFLANVKRLENLNEPTHDELATIILLWRTGRIACPPPKHYLLISLRLRLDIVFREGIKPKRTHL